MTQAIQIPVFSFQFILLTLETKPQKNQSLYKGLLLNGFFRGDQTESRPQLFLCV